MACNCFCICLNIEPSVYLLELVYEGFRKDAVQLQSLIFSRWSNTIYWRIRGLIIGFCRTDRCMFTLIIKIYLKQNELHKTFFKHTINIYVIRKQLNNILCPISFIPLVICRHLILQLQLRNSLTYFLQFMQMVKHHAH